MLRRSCTAISLFFLIAACGKPGTEQASVKVLGYHDSCPTLLSSTGSSSAAPGKLTFSTYSSTVICPDVSYSAGSSLLIQWSSDDPKVAQVSATGQVIARSNGGTLIRYVAGSQSGSVIVEVVHDVATLALSLPERVRIDQEFIMRGTLFDSKGSAINGVYPVLQVPPSLRHLGGDLYRAVATGPFEVTAKIAGKQMTAIAQVDGLAAYDGNVMLPPGVHQVPAETLRLENGRIRVRLSSEPTQRAGAVVEVATPDGWLEGTSSVYGDWTYPAAGVDTPPTRVTVMVKQDEVSFMADFDNHRFDPAILRYPADRFPEQPYPFTKEVVLREGDDGYFTRIIIHGKLPVEIKEAEHEVGFGGLWGCGEVKSGKQTLNLTIMPASLRWNLNPVPEAFVFKRDQDPVSRTLVPLLRTPVMTPVFAATEFGAVYAHSYEDGSYAAYLHLAPTYRTKSAREICRSAWRTAPFPVPMVSDLELAGCGPL